MPRPSQFFSLDVISGEISKIKVTFLTFCVKSFFMLVRSQMVPLAELIMKQGLVWSWASAEIFPGVGQGRHVAYIFRLLTMQSK